MGKYTYLLFFVVSCILSVLMFIQIPQETQTFYKIIMGITAFSFEIGKIQLWRRWVEHRQYVSLLFSLLFITLSILASVSFIVGNLNYQNMDREVYNNNMAQWEAHNKDLDMEIESLRSSLSELDPTWVSAQIRLSQRLEEVRKTKATLVRPSLSVTQEVSNVFITLGQVFKIDPKVLMVYFFIAFSLLLESGAVLLTPFTSTQVLQEKKKTMLHKVRKFSKVYTIGTIMLKDDDITVKTIEEIMEDTTYSEREILSVITYFLRKGFITQRGDDYILAIDKLQFLKNLKLLEGTE